MTIPEYPKIDTIFKRDMQTKGNPIVVGRYSQPEFEYLAGNLWLWTEKVDGTNVRIHWDGQRVTFGGRTANAQMPTFLLERLQQLFPPDRATNMFVEEFGAPDADEPYSSVTLFGEGFGSRIQKGGGLYTAGMPEVARTGLGVDFALFDVLVGDWWLKREAVEEVAQALGVSVVPVVSPGNLYDAVDFVRAGFNSAWGGFPAEGLVLRPAVELQTRAGRRIITKLKHKDFANVA